MKIFSKLLIRDEEDCFLLLKDGSKWRLPSIEIETMEERFDSGVERAESLGLKVSEPVDVVRLEIEDDETLNSYLVHFRTFRGEPEVEHKWVEPNKFVDLNMDYITAYNIVPMVYLDEYLDTRKPYSRGDDTKEIEVVKTLIRNDEGKFLAVRKSNIEKVSSGERFKKYGRMSGKWELPGGRIGKTSGDSNRFEAAKREIKEELGVDLSEGRDVVREEIEEVNDVNVYIVLYEGDEWDGKIQTSEEHSEYRWVTPREYLNINWHQDAGYGYPPMEFLQNYLEKNKTY